MAQLMYKIANEQPAAPTTLNPVLPECLVTVIQRALAQDQAQRYKNGEEMARAIRECAGVYGAVDVSL